MRQISVNICSSQWGIVACCWKYMAVRHEQRQRRTYHSKMSKRSIHLICVFLFQHDHTTNMIIVSDVTFDNYDIIADRTIKEASRVISFDAPMTSPEMPP